MTLVVVTVMPKQGVLDPQGQAVQGALQHMGFAEVGDVRVGKRIELEVTDTGGAGGLMAAQEGAMVKRFHSGRAAQSGVYAAQLAQRNFTGITDVLEAAYGGYLAVYSDTPNAKRITDDLGKTWETLNVGYKPHASVTSIHSPTTAARPRSENWRKPMTCLMIPNTGSTVDLRFA